jgi:PAS domain-containing protein
MSKRQKPKLDPNLAALRSAAKLPTGSARANKEASLVGPELLDARVRIASDLSVWSAVADVCARLVHNGEVEPLLAELLAVAIKVTGVDAGFIRVVPFSSTPVGIMASQGAVAGMVDVAQKLIVPASVLIPEQTRVSFDDLRLIQTKKPDALLQAAVASGFRGFQATPLLSRHGPKIGSLYTFSNRPGRSNARDLYVLDILCRQVADFIDWRLAGAEVTRSDAHLRSILDSTLDAIVTVDSEGIVRSANSAALKIFGMDPVALVGQNIGVLAPEATRAQ